MRNDGEGCMAAMGIIFLILMVSISCYFAYQEHEVGLTIEKAIVTDKTFDDEYQVFYVVIKHRDRFHIFPVKKSFYDTCEPKKEIDVEQPVARNGNKLTPRLVKAGGT